MSSYTFGETCHLLLTSNSSTNLAIARTRVSLYEYVASCVFVGFEQLFFSSFASHVAIDHAYLSA